MDHSRLSMTLGDVIFTQRSIRRFRPESVQLADLELILAAAAKAPNGGNNAQIGRFVAVTDRDLIREFGTLYREAWWAKRRDGKGWSGPEDLSEEEHAQWASPMQLADEMGNVPCVVFALSLPPNEPRWVLLAVQNLMLAARALGIGSVPTTLHPSVEDRFRERFGIPAEVAFHFAIPLGYPAGSFGPTRRRPSWETSYLNRWEGTVPWAPH
jgi:nitroreductase